MHFPILGRGQMSCYLHAIQNSGRMWQGQRLLSSMMVVGPATNTKRSGATQIAVIAKALPGGGLPVVSALTVLTIDTLFVDGVVMMDFGENAWACTSTKPQGGPTDQGGSGSGSAWVPGCWRGSRS